MTYSKGRDVCELNKQYFNTSGKILWAFSLYKENKSEAKE
jgi:hypothetical protein